MTRIYYLLLSAIALCYISTLLALPMEGFATSRQCRCLKTTASFIHPRNFRRIEILPAGAHCRNIEILITTKDNKKVCVSPEAEWFKKFLDDMRKSEKRIVTTHA